MKGFDFKRWEVAMMLFAATVSLAGFVMLYTGIPYWRSWLGLEDVTGEYEVGKLSQKEGSLKRQISGEAQFAEISIQAPLYNQDTLVTSDSASAVVSLNDGSKIEMSPNSMIRLVFTPTLSLEGIQRIAKVEVFTGRIKSSSTNKKILITSNQKTIEINPNEAAVVTLERNKAPEILKSQNETTPAPEVSETPSQSPSPSPSESPSPSPIENDKITIILPKAKTAFSVPKNSSHAIVTVPIRWKTEPKKLPVTVVVNWVNKDDKKELLSEKVSEEKSQMLSFKATRPGLFEVIVRSETGSKQFVATSFRIERTFEGIKILEPLVGGQKATSNALRGNRIEKFNITLQWEKYPTTKQYRVRIFKPEQPKVTLLEKTVDDPLYVLNKEKVFSGEIGYEIKGELESGFVVTAPPQNFIFNFLPPALVVPENNATWSPTPAEEDPSGGAVLFTWQKTNFTDNYEFQLAKDPQFTNKVTEAKQKENFLLKKSLTPGIYYWRVRSASKAFFSRWSEAYRLQVKPNK